jgi:hypothetical protein
MACALQAASKISLASVCIDRTVQALVRLKS